MSDEDRVRLEDALHHIGKQKPLAAYASRVGVCVGYYEVNRGGVLFRRVGKNITAGWTRPLKEKSWNCLPYRTETLAGPLAERAAALIDRKP